MSLATHPVSFQELTIWMPMPEQKQAGCPLLDSALVSVRELREAASDPAVLATLQSLLAEVASKRAKRGAAR